MTRLLADAISHINFGCITNARTVTIKYSKHTDALCKILYDNGVIQGYSGMEASSKNKNRVCFKSRVIRVEFKFRADKSFFKGIRRISRPGGKAYWNIGTMTRRIAHDNNIIVISTSQGMMTLKDAVLRNIGGEAVCAVYMRGA